MSPRVRFVLLAASCALALAVPSGVRADDSEARTDELFRRGKEQLAGRNYAEACALLGESYQLDPATGSLLALAMCHEREGKLATAYREYLEVEKRAAEERNAKRGQAARARSAALLPQLSKLTIDASSIAESPGAAVRWNGTPLQSAHLGVGHLVDGGTLEIEASALGYKVWHTLVTVAPSGDVLTVYVPPLEPLSVAELAPVPPAPPPAELPSFVPVEPSAPVVQAAAPMPRSDASPPMTRLSRSGLGMMGTGAVGMGLGVMFVVSAVSHNEDSKDGCDGDLCTPAAREARLAAHRAGNAATVSFAVSGALVMGGMISYLYGRHHADGGHALAPWLAPHAAGATFQGKF